LTYKTPIHILQPSKSNTLSINEKAKKKLAKLAV
jgi:hypothetical protein